MTRWVLFTYCKYSKEVSLNYNKVSVFQKLQWFCLDRWAPTLRQFTATSDAIAANFLNVFIKSSIKWITYLQNWASAKTNFLMAILLVFLSFLHTVFCHIWELNKMPNLFSRVKETLRPLLNFHTCWKDTLSVTSPKDLPAENHICVLQWLFQQNKNWDYLSNKHDEYISQEIS